ncbi:MAG: TetR/AcrR family transcriptional regulator [Desulfobacterales bacterium]|nr:TetR/AcrR family transcriptional regulator [Desulfobacterales bacterium]MDJ0912680.1 TetR/AcrR family transcriptional regulator [Desulfobacterales bacterium]
MSPKYVDKKERIKAIAQIALKLFAQRGYSATHVNQIADEAGIGKSTVYEYFKTKEDLFFAAIKEWMFQFESQLAEQIKDRKDPIEKLNAVADLTMQWVEPMDPSTLRLSLEILRHSLMENGIFRKRRHLMKELHAGSKHLVIDVLLEGISKGVFKPKIAQDTENIAINLLAYLDGISLHSMISENYIDLKRQINFYMQHLLQTILVDPDLLTRFQTEPAQQRFLPA